MAKRTIGDLTVDIAPRPSKRMKLTVMETTDNKIGKVDEKIGITRTSNLKSPTMLLEGHKSHLYTCKFSPDGVNIASAGADKEIMIWHTYGECENHTTLTGHKGSILQLNWSGSNELLFSASTDETISIWDVEYGIRIKKIKDHLSIVNSIYPTKRGIQYFASGSDDGTAKIYDLRMKIALKKFDCTYQVTSVALMDDGLKLFTGGIDNDIRCWDCRNSSEPLFKLQGHVDTVTSLSLSKDQNYLLSNGMDNIICVWDVRPYISNPSILLNQDNSNQNNNPEIDYQNHLNESINKNKDIDITSKRLIQKLIGAQHGNEALLIKGNWSNDGSKICCGSSDRMVYIFDVKTGKNTHRLPGHKGSVNEVDFHPLEPIVVSCSSDKTLFLGEL